jgi:UDP-N-acetylmuramoyl-tripeptide--D-alanyl-D-alanine ligase
MTLNMTVGWVADQIQAAWLNTHVDRPLSGVSTDSRTLLPGNLFVALRGENFDGHDHLEQAVQGGAGAVVVEAAIVKAKGLLKALPPNPEQTPLLKVPDTLSALGDLAAAWRRTPPRASKPVVAITGSNGKTTTKDLCLAALGSTKPNPHGTQGNLNNLIGLPQTLLTWPDDAWAAVLEMGMNAPGEIDRLADIAQPQVGAITCISRAHLGGVGLGSVEAIARAKCELLARLPSDGIAVLNADDAVLRAAADQVLGDRRCLYFGRGTEADVRLLGATPQAGGMRLDLQVLGQPHTVDLPLMGEHNAYNAAAAVAVAVALNQPIAAAVAGLAQVQGARGRLRQQRLPGSSVTLVDDTYNANPDSMKAAFSAVAQAQATSRAPPGRLYAVLGDMFELGPTAPSLHAEVGAAAAATKFDVFALGPNSAHLVGGCTAAGGRAKGWADDLPALVQALTQTLQPNDWVLVKGSRGMKMERVVQALTQEAH